MKDSKYEPVIGEDDEEDDADSEGEGQQAAAASASTATEEIKEDEVPNAVDGLIASMAGLRVREEGDF